MEVILTGLTAGGAIGWIQWTPCRKVPGLTGHPGPRALLGLISAASPKVFSENFGTKDLEYGIPFRFTDDG